VNEVLAGDTVSFDLTFNWVYLDNSSKYRKRHFYYISKTQLMLLTAAAISTPLAPIAIGANETQNKFWLKKKNKWKNA